MGIALPAQVMMDGRPIHPAMRTWMGLVSKDPAPLAASLVINVADYGAVGDDVANDTAAIQGAIDALPAIGGSVYFPAGYYKLTAALTITTSAVLLIGAGQFTSVLKQYTASSPVIENSGTSNQIEKIGITYSPTPTSGGNAINSSGSNTIIRDVIIIKAHIGINFSAGTGQMASHIQIQDYVSVGILFTGGASDCYVDHFILNAGNATNGALGGLRFVNLTQAIMLTNGEILNGVYSMTSTASVFAAGSCPAFLRFTDVFFDSSALGCLVEQMIESGFVGCWFSNGRSAGGFNGCDLHQTDSLKFTNCEFFNCGYSGLVLNTNASRIIVRGCAFESNSETAGAGVAPGFAVATGVSDFVVQGCIAKNGLYSGTQGYGISVSVGGSDRYIIADNLVTGNATGGVQDGGTGVNKRVANNY